MLRESLAWLGTHLAGNRGAKRSPVRHPRQPRRLARSDRLAARRCPSRCCICSRAAGSAIGATRHRARVVVHLRPRRPDTDRRRPAALPRWRLPRATTALADARRRADLHRRPAAADLYVVGNPSSSWRTRATTRTTTCSSGSARSTPRADPATSATDIAVARIWSPATAPAIRHHAIELDAVAHRFGAGSRIRVLVAGGSHPRFVRNLGTGEPLGHRQAAAACHAHRAPRRAARRGCYCPRVRLPSAD